MESAFLSHVPGGVFLGIVEPESLLCTGKGNWASECLGLTWSRQTT